MEIPFAQIEDRAFSVFRAERREKASSCDEASE